MKYAFVFALLLGGCTREGSAVGGGGDGTDGGASDDAGGSMSDGGTTGTGDDMSPAMLPELMPGKYTATSSGLLANNCQAPPEGTNLGTWTVTKVAAGTYNIIVDPNLTPAVVTAQGDAYRGSTSDSGMPLWGCQMRETYRLSLDPMNATTVGGTMNTVFEALSGDCSQYEPVLPCQQMYQVTLTIQ
jgi:hypothetical protein